MGVYDIFYDKCPNCGKVADSQCKWGLCVLHSFYPGEHIDIDIEDGIYQGWDCYSCGIGLGIVIQDRVFLGYVDVDPDPHHMSGDFVRLGDVPEGVEVNWSFKYLGFCEYIDEDDMFGFMGCFHPAIGRLVVDGKEILICENCYTSFLSKKLGKDLSWRLDKDEEDE